MTPEQKRQHTHGWEANTPVHHYTKSSHEWRRLAKWAWDIRGEIPVHMQGAIQLWTEIAEGFEELANLAYDYENSPEKWAAIWERTDDE